MPGTGGCVSRGGARGAPAARPGNFCAGPGLGHFPPRIDDSPGASGWFVPPSVPVRYKRWWFVSRKAFDVNHTVTSQPQITRDPTASSTSGGSASHSASQPAPAAAAHSVSRSAPTTGRHTPRRILSLAISPPPRTAHTTTMALRPASGSSLGLCETQPLRHLSMLLRTSTLAPPVRLPHPTHFALLTSLLVTLIAAPTGSVPPPSCPHLPPPPTLSLSLSHAHAHTHLATRMSRGTAERRHPPARHPPWPPRQTCPRTPCGSAQRSPARAG